MRFHGTVGGQLSIIEVRRILAAQIARHTPADAEILTAIPNVFLTSRTKRGHCAVALEPCLLVFAQGKKTVRFGTKIYRGDQTSFLLTSIQLPLGGQVVEAAKEVPLLHLRLVLDMAMVREVLSEESSPPQELRPHRSGLAQGQITFELLDACSRLLALLDTPEEIPFLNRLIQREIIFRVLRSAQGHNLRSIATLDDPSHRTTKALTWLKLHYADAIKIKELASMVGMGVSTLNAHFRNMVGISPLQYQKQMRLHAARSQMLLKGIDASTAAVNVGYESVTQFNREYRRMFGQPPMRDVRHIRLRVGVPHPQKGKN